MSEEASLEFRLTKIDETRNYVLDEIKHNDLLGEKYRNMTCKYSNHVKHLLILGSTITDRVSVSALASLICVLVGILRSTVVIKLCAGNCMN